MHHNASTLPAPAAEVDCYACQGTGIVVGFGRSHGHPCPCAACSECGDTCNPRHDDEGRRYCDECQAERRARWAREDHAAESRCDAYDADGWFV